MNILLKILNPFIYLLNMLNYFSHMDMYSEGEYEPYDFNNDIEYY